MKKIFLGITAATMCVALVGCGNSGKNAAITELSNQLDETANTISNVQTVNPTDINVTSGTLEKIATKNGAIQANVANTRQTLSAEEQYKMEILDRTEAIKKGLTKNVSLSKAQVNAVKELTNNLNKYTNSVAYTRNDLNKTVKEISSLKKNGEKNADRLSAKLNRLACNSNARTTYYENILNTLDQIENYVGCDDCNQEKSQNINTEQIQLLNNPGESTENYERPHHRHHAHQRMHSHRRRNQEHGIQEINNLPNTNTASDDINNTANNPYTMYNSNNFNRLNGFYGGYNANRMGNYYGENGNFNNAGTYNSNGINNGYEMGNRIGNNNGFGGGNGNYGMYNNRFNPSRNTDTYAPLTRNIDTYRLSADEYKNGINGFGGVVASTEPEQRLETFEKVTEDNTIEKVDNKDENKIVQTSAQEMRLRKVANKRTEPLPQKEDDKRVVAHVEKGSQAPEEENSNQVATNE